MTFVPPLFADVRAIFFDLDDTLCGYWEASKFGLRRTFELHAPEGITPEKMVLHWAVAFRKFVKEVKNPEWYDIYLTSGEPTRTEQMRRTLLEIGVEDEDMAQRLSATYAAERDGALALFEDAIEVLEALKPRYPLGLITNGPADIQRQEIETVGIGRFIDHVFIEGEMRFGKPEPEVFRRAEAAVGFSGPEILFVGNSYAHDIRPAVEAGWRSAWIRRPTDVPPSVGSGVSLVEQKPDGAPEPDVVIGELLELLPLLGVLDREP